MAIDWDSIRADYVAGGTSYRKLADKYGVHYKLISKKSKAEGWIAARSQVDKRVVTKTVTRVATQKAVAACRSVEIADMILEELVNTLQVTRQENGFVCSTDLNAAMNVIEKYNRTNGLLFGITADKTHAEIEKLRREASGEDSTAEIVVRLEGGAEDYV